MLTFTQSTMNSPSVIWSSIKRLAGIIRHGTVKMLPLLICIALLNRAMVYIIYPAGIGRWVINLSELSINSLTPTTQLLLTLPTVLQYPLIATCIYLAYYHIQADKDSVTLSGALWYTLTRLHIIFITYILYLIAVGIGCVVFILPGIYILGIFSMAIPGVMLAKRGIYTAFTESKKLTKDSVMYTLILLGLSAGIPNILFATLGPLFYHAVPNPIINEILILGAFTINMAIIVSAITFTYIELNLRQREKVAMEEALAAAQPPAEESA